MKVRIEAYEKSLSGFVEKCLNTFHAFKGLLDLMHEDKQQ
jgi:hypothetical protein